MTSLQQVDELVKEYLLFRSFTNTFRALETESRLDRDKGFQVDKILDELLGYITTSDVQRLTDYYRYLDLRFFSRLDSRFQRTVKKFELCLLRHYLVYAIQHKRRDKVIEFFDTFGSELHGKPEWAQWFALPYVKNPATDPAFETFFSKQWIDNYTISLHNFLATTFQHMPLPSLLSFNMDRIQRKAQQAEVEALKSTIENLKATVEARENEVAKLKHEVAETRKEMTDGLTMMRRRAASMNTELNGNGATIKVDTNRLSVSDTTAHITDSTKTPAVEDEPFLVVSQEEYMEHASAITHARFSSEGNLIASCDMDNIVRIWSHKGQSFNPIKINNNASNILSMEWDARSDRFLFLGTDTGLIRVYNIESKSVVQEFKMETQYPWVTQLLCSPAEPILVCAGSSSRLDEGKPRSGALMTWSMKSMSSSGTFQLEKDACADINTINLNHNGQMLVTGDQAGYMRIFDVRSMKNIVEWKGPNPSCIAQFSFDENSIYAVDDTGELRQWSIHKPGTSVMNASLQGFPPPPAYPSPTKATHLPHMTMSASATTATLPAPRPTSNTSTSSLSRSSTRSASRAPKIAVDDSVTQSLLSVSPRSHMVAFDAETEFCLCATTSTTPDTSATTQGTLFRVADGSSALKFGHQPAYQKLTAVDWTSTSNACLLAGADGSVKVTSFIKV
ncbi:WD40-repeat-containing domain protein [Syncephalastrum racemosum]|uniref:WD40-repeat-containing domain protein n=1 Tax=Syncephalastrum racemosum TaxID=13706 RepID=A0A1X2HAZ2_SYNRA|nr:WD40-repeat-containing domain protein [Syncephalastrum racemosum]